MLECGSIAPLICLNETKTVGCIEHHRSVLKTSSVCIRVSSGAVHGAEPFQCNPPPPSETRETSPRRSFIP